MNRFLAIAGLCIASAAAFLDRAVAGDDLFQDAVNYVLTGRIDPPEAPEIVDRKSCIVVMRDPKYARYIRYYFSRFRMDSATFVKTYSGSQTQYRLQVDSDKVLIEYLDVDKTTVAQGYKSADIALPGDIQQTQKALKIIFSDYCKPDKQQTPF